MEENKNTKGNNSHISVQKANEIHSSNKLKSINNIKLVKKDLVRYGSMSPPKIKNTGKLPDIRKNEGKKVKTKAKSKAKKKSTKRKKDRKSVSKPAADSVDSSAKILPTLVIKNKQNVSFSSENSTSNLPNMHIVAPSSFKNAIQSNLCSITSMSKDSFSKSIDEKKSKLKIPEHFEKNEKLNKNSFERKSLTLTISPSHPLKEFSSSAKYTKFIEMTSNLSKVKEEAEESCLFKEKPITKIEKTENTKPPFITYYKPNRASETKSPEPKKDPSEPIYTVRKHYNLYFSSI